MLVTKEIQIDMGHKVLRITARFDAEGVKVNDKGDITSIDSLQYYTKFGFVPNPDGSFYDLGFGHLLGPLNEAVNTNINQLIDAGTLNNLQAGSGGFLRPGGLTSPALNVGWTDWRRCFGGRFLLCCSMDSGFVGKAWDW